MEFGIFILMQQRGYHQTSAEVLNAAVEQTVLADQAGFDAAWYAEHHFSNYGLCPSPLMMVTHMAALTKRIRLGSAVCVLPMYHPLRLLAEAGFADTVSNGRLEFGVGSGYQKFEFDRFGVRIEDAPAIFNEFLDVIQLGLTEKGLQLRGEAHPAAPDLDQHPLGAEADAADLAGHGPPGGPGARHPRGPQPLRHGPAQRHRQAEADARRARQGRRAAGLRHRQHQGRPAALRIRQRQRCRDHELPRERALPAADLRGPEVPPRAFR